MDASQHASTINLPGGDLCRSRILMGWSTFLGVFSTPSSSKRSNDNSMCSFRASRIVWRDTPSLASSTPTSSVPGGIGGKISSSVGGGSPHLSRTGPSLATPSGVDTVFCWTAPEVDSDPSNPNPTPPFRPLLFLDLFFGLFLADDDAPNPPAKAGME